MFKYIKYLLLASVFMIFLSSCMMGRGPFHHYQQSSETVPQGMISG